MKKKNDLRTCAAKSRAALQLNNTLIWSLFVALISFSACDPQGCGEGPEPTGMCNTTVTVEENNCWISAEGNFWFRTAQGKLLMPVSSSVKLPQLHTGMRLELGYETVEQEPQNVFLCNFLVATEMPEQSIRITCAAPASGTNIPTCGTGTGTQTCSISATAENVVCGAGIWYNTWLRLDDGTLLQPYETSLNIPSLRPGQRYRIGYELMQRDNRYLNAVICQAVPPVAAAARITCLEEAPAPDALEK